MTKRLLSVCLYPLKVKHSHGNSPQHKLVKQQTKPRDPVSQWHEPVVGELFTKVCTLNSASATCESTGFLLNVFLYSQAGMIKLTSELSCCFPYAFNVNRVYNDMGIVPKNIPYKRFLY